MTAPLLLQTVIALTFITSLRAGEALGQPDASERVIPMRLEIILDSPRCVVLENFTLKVRMINPNDFPVTLRGFKMGYIEPEIHFLGSDGEYHHLYYGAMDSAFHHKPVTVPAHEFLEHHRFLFKYFDWQRWPVHPGVFALRPKTHLSRGRIDPDGEWAPIAWECPSVELRVEAQSWDDRKAVEFLRKRLLEYDEAPIDVHNETPVNVFRANLFREFLDRYPNAVYAPEIRWELAKLLVGDESTLKDEPMVDLFDECLTFCLERGGAYAEEFLELDRDHAHNQVLELAFMHQRPELLKRIVQELDRKHPEDEQGILYRRVVLAGMTESLEKAREEAATLRERFPDGKYVRNLDSVLRYLERKRGPVQPRQPTP